MGIINAIGAWFEKTVGGFIFGTKDSKLTMTGNVEAVGDPLDLGYEHTFQPENGVVAHMSDIPGDATDLVKGIARLYTSLGTNTDGSIDQATITSILDKLNRRKSGLYYWNDFFGVGQNDTGQFINDTIMNFVSSGAGAFNRPLRNTENPSQVTNSNIGVLQQSTGSTSTGLARIEIGSNGGAIVIGIGEIIIDALVCMNTLSTPTERYSYKHIMPSLLPSGIHAIGFVYDEGGVDNMSGFTASPNWQIVTRNTSFSTYTDTGVPVSNTVFQKLTLVINAAGTSVQALIDDVPVIPPIGTNIPTGWAKKLMYNSIILKFVGTAERIAYVDYVELDQTLTTPRL
jgi:hypothetical protein